MSPTAPTSPSRLSFRSNGMTSSTSLTSPSIRSHRPSFGSVRLFGTHRGNNIFDASGDPLSQQNSMVGDAPPTLDVPVLDLNTSHDEAFVKSALEGIAEVRVSQEIQRSLPLKLDTTSASTPKPPHNPLVSSPLSREESSAPGLDDTNAAEGTQLNRLSTPNTPLKRKAIPTELFGAAGVPPSTSPGLPDVLSSSGHKLQASALSLTVPGSPPQASKNPEINITSPENGQGDKTPTNAHVPSVPA